ncbi:hypothetical protein [Natrinema gari]|nr:hypothetical protein [Natrinema gari]
MSEVCPVCGEDPDAGYRCQNCGKDLVGRETETEAEESKDLMADGGQLETTDEIVLKQVDDLDDEGKHGAPIGDVVDEVLEESEVSFSVVFETIDWMHAYGEIYCPARGYLRETPETVHENGGDGA